LTHWDDAIYCVLYRSFGRRGCGRDARYLEYWAWVVSVVDLDPRSLVKLAVSLRLAAS
jgi:hypothetical protein